jgi:hypothetical protein
VATILLDDNNKGQRRIILHQRGRGWQRISYMHLAYDPLHFSLLLPNGDLGWHAQSGIKVTPQAIKQRCFMSSVCRIWTLHQGQWVLIAALCCKLISVWDFHTNYQNTYAYPAWIAGHQQRG